MELKIIIITIVTIMFITLNLILLSMIIVYRRKNKLKNAKKNLAKFSPVDLQRKLESYSQNTKDNDEIADITKRINELHLREFKNIEKEINHLNKYTLPTKLFKFVKFSSGFKELIKNITEYEKEYLTIRFRLFDLTFDIEIENLIISKLKDKASSANQYVINSNNKRVNNSRKLHLKTNKLREELQKLDETKNDQTRHLSQPFIKEMKSVERIAESIQYNARFIENNISYLENEIKKSIKEIVETYKNNEDDLQEIKNDVSQFVKKIKKLREEIDEGIDGLKHKFVNEQSIALNKSIKELKTLIESNLDFSKFLNKNENVHDTLLKFIHKNHSLFVSEIKRHKTDDEFERLMLIENALRSLEDVITKFEREKMNQFTIRLPESMSNILLNIINSYDEYIKVVKKNVSDISNINSKTNEINNEIALMNTGLLQIEQNLNGIHGTLKDLYEKEKNNLQNNVSILRKDFRNNTEKIDESIFKEAREIKKKIDLLVEKTKGSSFEFFFLKEVLMILNKYRGDSDEFDLMVVSLEESYKNEKINASIRKAKEIIEMYGIKE